MALNRYTRSPFGFDDRFFGPSFDDPFKDWMMPVLSRPRSDDMTLLKSSPGYEINEQDGKFMLSVDVPGIKREDMNVELENDGKVVHISGGRKVVKQGETSETKFSKRFTIGENLDTDQLTANLSDGVLTVTAPIKEEVKPQPKRIAITEGGS